MIVYWRLLRFLVWYALPHIRVRRFNPRRTVAVELSWSVIDLPHLYGWIRRGWYQCDECGRRWNTMAAGAHYTAKRMQGGEARLVGSCGPCRAIAKVAQPWPTTSG